GTANLGFIGVGIFVVQVVVVQVKVLVIVKVLVVELVVIFVELVVIFVGVFVGFVIGVLVGVLEVILVSVLDVRGNPIFGLLADLAGGALMGLAGFAVATTSRHGLEHWMLAGGVSGHLGHQGLFGPALFRSSASPTAGLRLAPGRRSRVDRVGV